jgi:hypothetical protein
MADTDIKIGIKADTKGAEKGLSNLDKGAKKASSSFSKMGSALKGSLASVFSLKGAIAAAASGFAIGKLVQSANVQEDAINSLNTALKITGKFSTEASESFQEYASALQGVTKFGDEAILQTGALIQQLGDLDQKALKRATKASVDLAAALNIDLQTAANLVGKAAGGMTSSLSRYGIQVKKGKTDSESFANALDALEAKFGGSAQAQVKTFSGALQQAQNTFGDLLEELGFLITKNPIVIEGIQTIAKGFGELIKVVKENEDGFKSLATDVFKSLVGALGFVTRSSLGLAVSFLKIKDAAKEAFDPSDFRKKAAELEKEIENLRLKFLDFNLNEDDGAGLEKLVALRSQKQKELEVLRDAHESELEEANIQLKALEDLQQKARDLELTLNKKFMEDKKAQRETEKDNLEEEEEIKKELTQEQAEARLEALETELLAGKITREKFLLDRAALEKQAADGNLKLSKATIKTESQLQADSRKKQLLDFEKFKGNQTLIQAKADAARLQGQQLYTSASLSLANNLASLSVAASGKQSKELFIIQKAAALANTFVSTQLAAANALLTTPPFPNFALATLVQASGAAGMAAIAATAIQGFAKGGMVEGGIPNRDSVPIMAQRGELVVPRQNFDEVINAVSAERETQSPVEIMIGFTDDAFEIIENKLLERGALGIGNLA